ncbi:MAG: type II secretion system protein [Alphaproteobacteria bacterium]|nr:type II secretion system protein [Alphaproteobacteria bacterium]
MRTHNHARCRGFTLTELAIVLGIMGTIIGAIWVAAGHVNATNRVQKASGQVMQIVAGYRSLYTQHGVDVANNTDITCAGVTANFFPSDMLPGVACATGTASTYPLSPWNASVTVLADQTNSAIQIQYAGLTADACINFANAVTNSSDVVYESISGTAQSLPPLAANVPYTTTQIAAACNKAGSANYVYVKYLAR